MSNDGQGECYSTVTSGTPNTGASLPPRRAMPVLRRTPPALEPEGDTYYRRAQQQGASPSSAAPAVTGASKPPLAAPNWSRDPVPREPALGYCVDDLPDMTKVER